jgi:hypothetical protein
MTGLGRQFTVTVGDYADAEPTKVFIVTLPSG